MQELAQLEIMTQNDTLDTKGQVRYSEVVQQLDLIGAESAERRAIELLDNLGMKITRVILCNIMIIF